MKNKSMVRVTRALKKAGYTYNIVAMLDDITAIRVSHDYEGLYPTTQALNTSASVISIAKKCGCDAEARGCYTATYIYTF